MPKFVTQRRGVASSSERRGRGRSQPLSCDDRDGGSGRDSCIIIAAGAPSSRPPLPAPLSCDMAAARGDVEQTTDRREQRREIALLLRSAAAANSTAAAEGDESGGSEGKGRRGQRRGDTDEGEG